MTSTFPVGTVVPMIGQSSSSPQPGWLLCDGSDFDRNTYPDLAKLLPGKLPDLRNYVLVGAGDLYKSGDIIGSSTNTLTLDQMPSHQHYGPLAATREESLVGFGQTNATTYQDGNNKTVTYYGFKSWVDNCYLYGTTFSGGTGFVPIDIKSTGTPTDFTYGSYSSNNSFSVMQPSYAVNYYIYAGAEVVSASEEKGNV